MVIKKISMDLDADLIWRAKVFGAKNKIPGGFTGVVKEALANLIPVQSDSDVLIDKHLVKEGGGKK